MTQTVRGRSARNAPLPADVLRSLCERAADREVLRVVRPAQEPGAPDRTVGVTRGALMARSYAVAAALADRVEPGDRVLVLLDGGPDLFAACLAAWHLGAAAVPVPPPAGADPERALRLAEIALDAEVSAVVTTRPVMEACRPLWQRRAVAPLAWRCVDDLPDSAAPPARSALRPSHPALLLYTSGSTSSPKGVVVPHERLRATLELQRERTGLPDGGHVVNWLPAHHALGFGSALLAAYAGGCATLIQPGDFVDDPMRWLRAITAADAPVLSGGAPFGYERCVAAADEERCAGLDLSHWQTALIGAERIRPRTLTDFTEAFAPYGFRTEAWFPAYGLTETMLIVTGHRSSLPPVAVDVDAAALERGSVEPAREDTARAQTLVGCGSPGPGAELLIVDPDTRRPCPDRKVGELWITGPVVMDGYWRRTEETAATFHGMLADGGRRYLRTGDLGFLHEGELVVCGRLKELVIVRGRNLHPQDIEQSCRQAEPGLTGLPTAAFSVETEEQERLVVVQGIDDRAAGAAGDLSALARELARAVTAAHDVEVHDLVLVPAHRIPKTASGKVRRAACRTAHRNGELTVLARAGATTAPDNGRAGASGHGPRPPLADALASAPGDARHDVLVRQLGLLLGDTLNRALDDADTDRTLLHLGMDSLRTMELRALLHRELGVLLPMSLLGGSTPRGLADALLKRLPDPTAEQPAPAASPVTSAPGDRYQPFPLTDLQQAYLAGRDPEFPLGGVSTHFYAEFDAEGLDTSRLGNALDRLVARHDMLRAVFGADGTQRVLPPEMVPGGHLTEYDLRGRPGDEIRRHLDAVREEMSHALLPTDRAPLLDIRVSVQDADRCRVHVGLDLLVFDVWSLRLFFREWQTLYEGRDDALPPLELTFRDYVLATRQDDGMALEAARAYWHERLDSLLPGPELPLAAAVEPRAGHRFRRLEHRLDRDTWAELRRRAATRGLTPAAVLLAAYATVLGRWSRGRRFTLNLPTFNRHRVHPEVDAIVGDFTSVTLLEADLGDADQGIGGLATQIQRRLWSDLEHRAYSGVRVLRDLARRRPPTAGGLFSPVVFAGARGQAPDGDPDLPVDWLGERAFGITQTPQVLLDHQVWEDADGLSFNWDHVEELFPPGLVDDLFGAYCRVLEGLAIDDRLWESGPADLRPVRQRALVAGVNETAGPVPAGLLHGGLLERAVECPEKVAVVAADGALTYGELRLRAAAVARRLLALGVRPGEPVAVSMGKGREQIVAALGVLMAGGAYLPLDPELPPERRHSLLERSGSRIVLTSGREAPLGWPGDVTEELVDISGPVVEGSVPDVPRAAGDLAYVIYTSGSTGVPKGVAVSHRAALNTCVDVCERFGVGSSDVVLGLSSLSFDLSVFDVFGVLGAGGTLVLPRAGSGRDPGHWLELVAEHGVTVWNSVPALMGMFVEHVAGQDATELPLKLVLLSGDWIPVELPDRVRAAAPGAQVVSLGGATEAGIWSIAYPIGEVDPAWDSIPYGRPLRNQRFHVLDAQWRECPVWVAGELFIAGTGLADGYWRDPERTAVSFVTHPVSGERLYRTGDVGRWLPSGDIEFLGREDFQVKVGGFRIELGEIEAALAGCEGVRAAVAAAPGARHHRRLVGYVVAERPADEEGLLERVRAHAERHLPGYMVPPVLKVIDEIPLSSNGKVDRAALPDPTTDRQEATPAATDLEEKILRVVSAHTPAGGVGVLDNFFDLGLDSLVLTRIHRRLRDELGLNFPITALFGEPNVRRLAGHLTGASTASSTTRAARDRASLRRAVLTRRAK
jgi:amino acid adenylation domain-containing protein